MKAIVCATLMLLAQVSLGQSPETVTIADIYKLDAPSNVISVVGTVTAVAGLDFVLSDDSGSVLATKDFRPDCRAGDLVEAILTTRRHPPASRTVYASRIKALRAGMKPIAPHAATIRELKSGSFDFLPVEICGTVTDVSRDELDPNFIYVTLESDDAATILTVHDKTTDTTALNAQIDTAVCVTGICIPNRGDYRQNLDRRVYIDPETAFHPIDKANGVEPRQYPHRQERTGTVLANCGHGAFYLRTDSGKRIKAFLSAGERSPAVGTTVTVAGFVRKNIFFTSLSNAIVVRTDPATGNTETPVRISPRTLLFNPEGKPKLKIEYEGRPIRIRGTVRSVSEPLTEDGRLLLDSEGLDLSVRLGAFTPPPVGSEVEVSGICSITSESDGNPYGFVRLTGFTLLTRGPEDVVILKNPPWWTPAKMLAVIAALLLLVVAVLIWNKALRALAERRGRELMDEQLGHVAADLKVNERTRLAVELHDALSQNLTGVSLQLDAVKRFADEDRGKMTRHLDMAMRTLKSCRDELRNCLWDLRNRALEEKDMNEAIRRTASPFVGDASLLIRFNVPRDQISDNTAHALMRIVRELATNAVRHGAAKTIRIAGALENGRLLFSVNDNGRGFDPADHLGVNEGHFGLDGIRERIEALGGSMEIESAAGKGTTIRISMTA